MRIPFRQIGKLETGNGGIGCGGKNQSKCYEFLADPLYLLQRFQRKVLVAVDRMFMPVGVGVMVVQN